VIRALKPALVPVSCEQCKPEELWPENVDPWDLFVRFPSMILRDPATGRCRVDYTAARVLASDAGIIDRLQFYEELEAIAEGLNHVRQQNPDRD